MAAITSFLVVNNSMCKSSDKILFPTTPRKSSWVVAALLASTRDGGKLATELLGLCLWGHVAS